eukprot:541403_1
MAASDSKLKILYIHGMESGPISVLMFGVIYIVHLSNYIKYGFVMLYLFLIIYHRKQWLSKAVKQSLEACIEIEHGAIEHYKPDIIIAASWGGFVTMELIQRGYWNGKTILLAPAYVQCMRWLHYK